MYRVRDKLDRKQFWDKVREVFIKIDIPKNIECQYAESSILVFNRTKTIFLKMSIDNEIYLDIKKGNSFKSEKFKSGDLILFQQLFEQYFHAHS